MYTSWHDRRIFPTAIKWSATAPFSFLRKTATPGFDNWQEILHNHTKSGGGKSTVARIALAPWRKHQKKDKAIHEIPFGEIDTPARLGRALSQTTYPVILDDAGDLAVKEKADILEILKSAAKTDVARGYYLNKTQYVKTLALSSIIVTSNPAAPRIDGYQRASICVHFDENEQHSEGQKNIFKAWIEPALDKLGVFGDFCARYLTIEKPALLLSDVENEVIQKELVTEFYRYAGLQVPEWLDIKVESTKATPIDDTGSTMLELRSFLNKEVNEAFDKYWRSYAAMGAEGFTTDSYGKPILSERDLLTINKIKFCSKYNLTPFLLGFGDGGQIAITYDIVTALKRHNRNVEGLNSLKDIAIILGFEHKAVRFGERVIKAAVGNIDHLVKFMEFR